MYIFSSHLLFWIRSYSSSGADKFSMIASHSLSLKNYCSCHFFQHHPQFSSPMLFRFLQICVSLPILNLSDIKAGKYKRGQQLKNVHNTLRAMKFKVYLQNFSEVLTRAGCGGTIYLVITSEKSHIFFGFILLLQDIF